MCALPHSRSGRGTAAQRRGARGLALSWPSPGPAVAPAGSLRTPLPPPTLPSPAFTSATRNPLRTSPLPKQRSVLSPSETLLASFLWSCLCSHPFLLTSVSAEKKSLLVCWIITQRCLKSQTFLTPGDQESTLNHQPLLSKASYPSTSQMNMLKSLCS